LGLTPSERWRGCQLGLNAATARLEPRWQQFPGVCEAETALESWTCRALAHCDRALARDVPHAHRLMTEGLDPAWGIAAVPVATILIRRADALDDLATKDGPGRPRFMFARAALQRRCFTLEDIEHVEDLLDCVEHAARCSLGRTRAPTPEELRAQ